MKVDAGKGYRHIKKEDRTTRPEEDKTLKSISYTQQELKVLIEKGHIPEKLGQSALKEMEFSLKKYIKWREFVKKNPKYSQEDFEKWWLEQPLPNRKDIEEHIQFHNFLLDNREALLKVLTEPEKEETFALPSHALMFTLFAIFAGRPEKIPRKLLSKANTEWTLEEKKEADSFITSIIQEEEIIDYSTEEEIKNTQYTAIVCDNPKVEAKAKIDQSLFSSDLIFREGSLAQYIKRTFGAEGMRHLYGLIIGLEENFRQGHFIWSVNEHLERLGYQKKANRSFDPEIKKTASEIIKVFQGLFITARKKEGKKEILQGERLFSIDGFRQEIIDKQIIDEKIKLRATDFWYKNAFTPKGNQSGQFTKLLKKIAKENHREHPLTIYLTGLLAIFFRMKTEHKMTIKLLMDWCVLGESGRYTTRNIRELEKELNYMRKQGYLGNWENNGEDPLPSKCKDPLSCCLTFTPPNWFKNEIQKIKEKRDTIAFKTTAKIITLAEFQQLLKESTLSNNQFGKELGVSGAYVSLINKGKKGITKELSKKIITYKNRVLTNATPLSH